MADTRISSLSENTAPLPTDLAVHVDVSDTTMDASGTNKRTTMDGFLKGAYGVTSTTSSSAPTPTGGYWRNVLILTALAENTTIGAPSGSPAAGNMLQVIITATGGTRSIAYNAALETGTVTRTTSLAAGSTLTQIYLYCDGAWQCQYDNVTT